VTLSDSELRALIRDAIARRRADEVRPPDDDRVLRPSASHARLAIATGGDGDGACIIEPSVPCTHCGYCVSFGH
jgi:hypothetical protein